MILCWWGFLRIQGITATEGSEQRLILRTPCAWGIRHHRSPSRRLLSRPGRPEETLFTATGIWRGDEESWEPFPLDAPDESWSLTCSLSVQIPEFSDGFWTGSQLACWTNSETPWSYFPKISIYLRDENSSRSFRLTILPQVRTRPCAFLPERVPCGSQALGAGRAGTDSTSVWGVDRHGDAV